VLGKKEEYRMCIRSGIASNNKEAVKIASEVGFPLLIIPFGGEFSGAFSYVVTNIDSLDAAVAKTLENSYPPARTHVVHRSGKWFEEDRELLLFS